jgi:putative FmdB family regulatory protein
MPINKYNCTECDFSEEYVESFSTSKENWHPEVCPKCEKGNLEKVFDLSGHRIGIDFVGPGFYVNV